jgi:hypothetical protein
MSTLILTENPNKIETIDLIKIYNPNKYHPYLYHLNKINWLIFGSLTWANEHRRKYSPIANWKRNNDFNDFINIFGGQFKFRKRNLCYYKATEFGGAGEVHCHFLIAREGRDHIEPDIYCNYLNDLWVNQMQASDSSLKGMGTAFIVPYDESKQYPGVKYCLKREFISRDEEQEREDYLSKGLIKLIKANNLNISVERNFNSAPDGNRADMLNNLSFNTERLWGSSESEDEISLAF